VENPEWEEGLAASLRVGLDALTRMSRAEAAFIVLGDQPEIPEEVPAKLIAAWQGGRHLAVVPKYRYASGNPVLVSRELWPRLMSLTGDEGARRLLQAHPEWVEEVWIESLPPRDIDTQRDIEELRPRR
jgi:molybdenum cofactor cytidylyltransferase